MVFLFAAAALLVLMCAFGIYAARVSLSLPLCRSCVLCHAILGGLGVILAIASVVMLAVLSRNIEPKAAAEVVRDSAYMYFTTAGVFFAIGFSVTLAGALMKVKLRPVIPVLGAMWSLPLLFWTYMCAAWSDFREFSASPFVTVYGIALSLVLLFSSLPELCDRVRLLSDERAVGDIKAKRAASREGRRLRRAEKKRISDKKKKLKDPNKKRL